MSDQSEHSVGAQERALWRAIKVLGKGVHHNAVLRLIELWPTAQVRVEHRSEYVQGSAARFSEEPRERRITRVTIYKRGKGMPDAGYVWAEAVCAPGDQWVRRKGIEIAFRRALEKVRNHRPENWKEIAESPSVEMRRWEEAEAAVARRLP